MHATTKSIQERDEIRRLIHSAGFLPPYDRIDLAMPYLKMMPEYMSKWPNSVWFESHTYKHPRNEYPWHWRAVLQVHALTPMATAKHQIRLSYTYLSVSRHRKSRGNGLDFARMPDKFILEVMAPDKADFESRLGRLVEFNVRLGH